jgi:hypothetical protein
MELNNISSDHVPQQEHASSRMLKKAVSKAAADESTGGVASGLR